MLDLEEDPSPTLWRKTPAAAHSGLSALEIDQIQPISELIKAREAVPAGQLQRTVYDSSVIRIATDITPILFSRLKTTEDAAVLWLIHCELTARNVPPVLRPDMQEYTRQHVFLKFAADLFWIATKHPGHVTLSARAAGVFKYVPDSEQWHKAAVYVYRNSKGRAYEAAHALALSDPMRMVLAAMPAKSQSAQRAAWRKAEGDIREQLIAYAEANPDKAGQSSPDEVVARQMRLLHLFALSGGSPTTTITWLALVDGDRLPRQQVKPRIREIKIRSAAADRLLGLRI